MRFETRRKLFHVSFGSAVFMLVYLGAFPMDLAVATLVIGLALSLVARNHEVPVIDLLLDWFERDHHQESFPGKGAFFSLLGMVTVIHFFPREVALAALGALVAGDTLSHLVGRKYGRVDNPLNPEKDVEGFLAGFTATFAVAVFFLHPATAAFSTLAGMVVESFEMEVFSFGVDDNLTVPVTVAASAHLFQVYALPLL